MVRGAAARALGEIGPAEVPAPLAALKDDDAEVRGSAAGALGRSARRPRRPSPPSSPPCRTTTLGGPLEAAAGALGAIGHVFNFPADSDGYVDLGTSVSLAPPTLTVAFWMYARSVRSDYTHPLGRWGHISSSPNSWLFDYRPNQTMAFSVFNTSGVQGVVISMKALPFNEWHHVAGTYDGSIIKLYLDGQLDAKTPFSGRVQANASTTSIGCKFADGQCYFPFDGLVDEPKFYSRALSAAEVYAIYVTAGEKRLSRTSNTVGEFG